MKKLFVILFVVSLSCWFAGTSMAALVTTVANSGTFGGHTYELVLVTDTASSIIGSTWGDARHLAQTEDPVGAWDLVSINSQAEQNWIVGTLIGTFGNDTTHQDHLWIGGYYRNGWKWVDGSLIFDYGWTTGEPPNGGGLPPNNRFYLQAWSDQGWDWDAVTITDGMGESGIQRGFIKETPIPEPGTMMLLGSGLVGLAGWGRKKFRK